MIAKERLIEHINKFPEYLEIEELIERLLFIQKIEKRIKSSNEGYTVSEEEFETEMTKWFK